LFCGLTYDLLLRNFHTLMTFCVLQLFSGIFCKCLVVLGSTCLEYSFLLSQFSFHFQYCFYLLVKWLFCWQHIAESFFQITSAVYLLIREFSLFLNVISFYFIHMCIQCLGHFSPLLPAPCLMPHPLPYSSNPSLPGRNYFALISNFVEETV
jgi:hypothetical protein